MIPEINGIYEKTSGIFIIPANEIAVDFASEYFDTFAMRMAGLSKKEVRLTVSENTAWLHAIQNEALIPGSYELTISAEAITVSYSDGEGLSNALTTLFLLIRDSADQGIRCGKICDTPKYAHRGFLLDVSRHYFSVETIKVMIEETSLHKMNRMHWHLSDNQGYRIESKLFPKLNEVGSWRNDADFGDSYGGFYTFDEIKEIVTFAHTRGMEIIPEIDMPGHLAAILRAYPEFTCSGEEVIVKDASENPDRILCAGQPQSIQFVKALLGEVSALFPYPYFHIGGDEVNKTEWKKCPHCQQKMQELGIADEEALQNWFTSEMTAYLKTLGKTAICWNDSLRTDSDLPALIQYWDVKGAPFPADTYTAGKRKWIYSYCHEFYFDYDPDMCPMRKTRTLPAHFINNDLIPDNDLLGIECALWTENILTAEALYQKAFPRIFAVADRGWMGTCTDDGYADFRNRVETELAFLDQKQITHMSVPEADPDTETIVKKVSDIWLPRLNGAIQYKSAYYSDMLEKIVRQKLNGVLSAEKTKELLAPSLKLRKELLGY